MKWSLPAALLALLLALAAIAPTSAAPPCGPHQLGGPACPYSTSTAPPPTPTPDPMAITLVANGGGGGNKTSEASTAMTTGGSTYPVGSLVIVWISADNAGTSGVSAITSVVDSGGNSYTQRALVNRTSGAALDGLTVAIYSSVITTALTGASSITINWSPNVVAKTFGNTAYSGAGAEPYDSGTASGSGATFSVGPSVSVLTGDLVVGVSGGETGVGQAFDTDTTNGDWGAAGNHSQSQVSGGSGGDATKMSGESEGKITTGAGTQTYNGNNGATTDWAAAYAVWRVALSPPFRHLSIHNALVR